MNVDISPVRSQLIDATGETVTVEHNQWIHDTTNEAEDLSQAGVLDTTDSAVQRFQFFSETQDSLVAEVVFTLFADGETAYISDLVVDEAYRGQGIGTQLRQCIVSALEPRTIYSYPTNGTITHITEAQGFEVAPEFDKNWYVKK